MKLNNFFTKYNKQLNAVWTFLFVCSPLIGVVLLCVFQGNSPFNIFLPNSLWNDEVFYYKQIEAIIHFGIPQGYFGYNEVPPNLLTFGAWSPMLFLPHVVLGSLFGWNIYSPIIFNLLFVVFSLIIFIVLTNPTLHQKVCLTIFVSSYTFLSRFIVSSMMEALSFSALILLLSLFIYILDYSKSSVAVYFYLSIALFFAMSRPYYAIFVIPVLVYCFLKKKYSMCIFSIISSIIAVVVFFWIEQNITAPYYAQVLNFSLSEVYNQSGFFGIITHFFGLIANGFTDMFDLFFNRDIGGVASIIYFFTFFQMAMLLISTRNIEKTKKESKIVLISVAATIFLLIISIFCFYLIYNGARHLAPVAFVSVFIVSRYCKKSSIINVTMSFILFVIIAPFGNMYNYNFDVPFGTKDDVAIYEETSMQMYELMKNPVSEGRWDNTVAFLAADYNSANGSYYETPWKPLYSVPKGYGINYVDYTAYQDDEDFSAIKSGYVLTRNGSVSEQRAYLNGSSLLLYGDNYVLIKN